MVVAGVRKEGESEQRTVSAETARVGEEGGGRRSSGARPPSQRPESVDDPSRQRRPTQSQAGAEGRRTPAVGREAQDRQGRCHSDRRRQGDSAEEDRRSQEESNCRGIEHQLTTDRESMDPF